MAFLTLTIVLATFTAIIGNTIGVPVPGPQKVFKMNNVKVDGIPNPYFSSLNITPNPGGLSSTVNADITKRMPENSTVEVILSMNGRNVTTARFPICDTPVLQRLTCPDEEGDAPQEAWTFSKELLGEVQSGEAEVTIILENGETEVAIVRIDANGSVINSAI